MKGLFFFVLLPIISSSQKITEDSMINKWIHSVINIETMQTDNNRINKMMSNTSIPNHWDSVEIIRESAPREEGSAMFLEYKSKFYLITARHVLINKNGYDKNNDSNNIVDQISLIDNAIIDNHKNISVDTTTIKGDFLYGKILANLSRPYRVILSSKKDDLAIMRINTEDFDGGSGKNFISILKRRGYVPIEISDIDTTCRLVDNKKIIAVGYPEESL